MGNMVSEQIDNADEKEAKAKEQLEVMMKLADARLDTFEGEIKTMFLDNECWSLRFMHVFRTVLLTDLL